MDKIHLLSTTYLCPTIKRYKFNTFKWNLIQSNYITKNNENIKIKLLFRVWPKIVQKKTKSVDISLLPLLQMQWPKLLKSNDNYSSEFRCFHLLINYFRELNSCLGISTSYSNKSHNFCGPQSPIYRTDFQLRNNSGIKFRQHESNNTGENFRKMSGRIYKS